MADYVIVPYSNYTDAANLYTDGAKVLRNTDTGAIFAIAQTIESGLDIRTAIYHEPNTRNLYQLISYKSSVAGDLYQTRYSNGVSSIVNTVVSPTAFGYTEVYDCYFTQLPYTYSEYLISESLTLFDNQGSALTAMWATPVVNPGVHVRFSPVYIPTYPAVHVQFNPVNLNPYEPGGESEPGGGGGDYDNPTDIINLPDLPTVKVSPFVKLWNPAEPEMQQLSDYIFSDNVWDAVSRQLFGNPIQYIISMGIVPVPLSIGGVKVPFHLGEKIGNFNMYEVGQQYMRYSCGSITIPQYWKSFMDYEPHTKIQIFLPFIGFRDLMASEVIGKEITVTYHIDVFSGACVAFVQPNGSVLYQYNGNVLTTIPYSANEFGNIITGAIGAVGGVATGLLGISGAFAPAIGGMMAISGFTNAFSSVVGMGKESVIHGGNASSTSGLLSTRTPYVILNRPKQAIAERQNEYHGYATWYRANDFLFAKGFTKLAQIHLEGIPATDWEIQEIERLLKEGVIF